MKNGLLGAGLILIVAAIFYFNDGSLNSSAWFVPVMALATVISIKESKKKQKEEA